MQELCSRGPDQQKLEPIMDDETRGFATGMIFPLSMPMVYTFQSAENVTFKSVVQSLEMRMAAIEASVVAQGRIIQTRVRALEAEIAELQTLIQRSSNTKSPKNPAAPPFIPRAPSEQTTAQTAPPVPPVPPRAPAV